MMKWGSKKPVSWFSKMSGSSKLKPAKEKKKQDDEARQKISTKSSMNSTKRGNDIHERSKRLQKVSVEKENDATRPADVDSNEKFEEIMSSVRRCEGRGQKLLKQKSKISEQEAEAKMKKPDTKTCTRSYSREDFVKLKEIKLREVMLKADQQRKSMYLRRELGKKVNSKVRVFSPRSCRVKAIDGLKKAKVRARKKEFVMKSADGGGMEKESFALVKCSSDPQKDFRDSMVEMIMENGIINHPEELKELLVCYLRLNTNEYHDMIINVFQQVHSDLLLH